MLMEKKKQTNKISIKKLAKQINLKKKKKTTKE
jgi:hypothetical protein